MPIYIRRDSTTSLPANETRQLLTIRIVCDVRADLLLLLLATDQMHHVVDTLRAMQTS